MKRLFKALCILGLIIINGIRLFNTVLWADEIATYSVIRKGWMDIIAYTSADVHPPLYYLITKVISMPFGYSILGIRVASMLAMIVLLVIGYICLRKMYSEQVAFLFSLLVLVAPSFYYTNEMRMYSWAYCFVALFVITGISFLRLSTRKKQISLLMLGLAAAYTHYFALIMVAVIYVMLFIRTILINDKKALRDIIVDILLSIFLYIPWFFILMVQVGDSTGARNINGLVYYIKRFIGVICMFSGNMQGLNDLTFIDLLLTTIALLVYLAALFSGLKSKNVEVSFLFMTFISVVAISFIAGCVMDIFSHGFAIRYIYPATGILWILIAISSDYIFGKKRIIMFAILFIVFISDAFLIIRKEQRIEYENTSTIDYVNSIATENDILVSDYNLFYWMTFDYYFPDLNSGRIRSFSDIEEYKKHYDNVYFFKPNAFESNIKYDDNEYDMVFRSSLGKFGFDLIRF